MQNELDDLKEKLTKRIHILFIEQYEGNKSQFAKAVGCDEKTLRLIFDFDQGMTINLFFKIAKALKITPSELLKDLELK